MKTPQALFYALLASIVAAVAAESFSYGAAFAAITFASQLPLLVVMRLFASAAERSGTSKVFVSLSLIISLLFLASGIEDIALCFRFGIRHDSDAGFARVGVEAASVVVFAIATTAWIFARSKTGSSRLGVRQRSAPAVEDI